MFSGKKIKELEDELLAAQGELSNTKRQLQQKEELLLAAQTQVQQLQADILVCNDRNNELTQKLSPVLTIEQQMAEKQQQVQQAIEAMDDLHKRYNDGISHYENLQKELSLYEEKLEIGSFGLYERRFDLESSDQYKQAIDDNFEEQKKLIKEDQAIVCHTEWSVGGSKTEGKKMTTQYKKLMLFAFNGECDSLIARVKWNNAEKSRERIQKSFEAINKLGASHSIEITAAFLDLKLKELSLVYEYENRKQEEKEEQRRIREQMREEEKAQREYERAKRDAEEEENIYEKALETARKELAVAGKDSELQLQEKIKALEQQLQEAQAKKERAVAMAQLTRNGHIYVISNIGSFGENVYKLGMTRRLDPLDRVKELGDASVPFHFDVHAIIYSENAPQLEYELHRRFSDRRLNRINTRKEFFRVSLDEIEAFVHQHTGAEIQFTKIAEARDYRETLTILKSIESGDTNVTVESKFPALL